VGSTALTPGHIDGGGGIVQAEVVFSSLNPSSVFSFTASTCATSGCHGGDPGRTGMSSGHRRGDHKKPCVTCHKAVVDSASKIVNIGLHVNGKKGCPVHGRGQQLQSGQPVVQRHRQRLSRQPHAIRLVARTRHIGGPRAGGLRQSCRRSPRATRALQ
jgi:hypothetical protein